MGISTMRSILVVLAIAVTAFAVTEVQELGNADASTSLAKEEGNADGSTSEANLAPQDEEEDDDVGEATGRRGAAGGFLSTTGSFTLSSNRGGNSEEDEDELGEGAGRRGGGRGGFLSTTGSFTL